MINSLCKAMVAGPWPVDLRQAIYRRQLQLLLLFAVPLLLWQSATANVWWCGAALLLLATMTLASFEYRHLPRWMAPMLMIVFLSLQVLLRLLTGHGLDAIATTCLLLMVLVAVSSSVLLGLISIAGWTVLLSIAPLWQPGLPSIDWWLVNLLMLCAALMLLLVAARMRIAMDNLYERYTAQADQLRRSKLNLTKCHEQNSGLLQRMEQCVEQRTAQLQSANRELVEANAQLEAFNYMVSHDMRASLRIMDGFAKVLRDDLDRNVSAAVRQDMDRLQSSIRHMNGMMVELLKLAKSSNTAITRSKLDLSALVGELLRDLQIVEPERRVDIEIAPDVYAHAEPELMREVLQNLLTNAWKFTARRHCARIQFGVSYSATGRVFYVRDNGVGFDMSRVAELFKPFSRLHAQEFEGTGVGLVSVKRIIERHGGRVWAMATPEQGAKLCFTLAEPIEQTSAAMPVTC